jgi:hypothetical protein
MQCYSSTTIGKDTRQSAASQPANTITAMATHIYEAGATYRLVEPDVFEVKSLDDNGKAITISADQFHMTLSLVRFLKSFTTIPVY